MDHHGNCGGRVGQPLGFEGDGRTPHTGVKQGVPASKRVRSFADGIWIRLAGVLDYRGGEMRALTRAPHERLKAEQEGIAGSGSEQGRSQRFEVMRAAIFVAVRKFSRERSTGSRLI